MIKPSDNKLFKKCIKASIKKFGEESTWKSSQWLVARYLSKGGIYTHSTDKDVMDAEKQAALTTIQEALVKNGFTKIDDNSFAIGDSRLQCKTIANLLEVSFQPWYQYVINQPIKLTTASGEVVINKGDYFSIAAWGGDTAVLDTAKMGAKPINIPTQMAYSLLHASRTLSRREKRYANQPK